MCSIVNAFIHDRFFSMIICRKQCDSMAFVEGFMIFLVSSRAVFIPQTSVHDIFYGIPAREAVPYLNKKKKKLRISGCEDF